MVRLLIVEDDESTARSLTDGLTADGYEVRSIRAGNDAMKSLSAHAFDLIILDWMLPGVDGLTLLQHLRNRGQRVPVLMLTARDSVADRVQGLEAGTDDYLAKPFAFAELLARVRALLRRSTPAEPLHRKLADLEMDYATRLVRREGHQLNLTPKEFDLLAYLLIRTGEVVSRDELAREVWRETNRATPINNIIDVHVAHLRRKLDDPHPIKLLHTVRGLGFVLREMNKA